MNKHLLSSLLIFASSTCCIYADNPGSELEAKPEPLVAEKAPVAQEKAPEVDVSKVSEAFGHLIGKNIETLGFEFDIAHVIKGIQEGAAGKEAPMTEAECVQAISLAQESSFKKEAQENLKKADDFLAKNAQSPDVVVMEEGKLQYKIEKAGEGSEVQLHFTPLVRYTGKYVDGTIFGSSKEDELVSLDETIPGLSKGMVGMKEGEKRTVYIHPELGYGTHGYLPPNSLLTFEIEVLKAQAPQAQPETDSISTSPNGKAKAESEIAAPLPENKEDVR